MQTPLHKLRKIETRNSCSCKSLFASDPQCWARILARRGHARRELSAPTQRQDHQHSPRQDRLQNQLAICHSGWKSRAPHREGRTLGPGSSVRHSQHVAPPCRRRKQIRCYVLKSVLSHSTPGESAHESECRRSCTAPPSMMGWKSPGTVVVDPTCADRTALCAQ